MNALSVSELHKTYRSGFIPRKREVLRGIGFEVKAGEVFAFLGPNGAGKTTTIKAIVGLLKPTSGRILVFGSPAGTIAANRRIGFLPENPYFYQYLKPEEFLQFHADLCGMPRSGSRARIAELLRAVGLGGAGAGIAIRKFSKGMVQRLGLAQAMLHDPEILILDEPLSGLDPVGRKEFRDIILGLRDRGRTIFFSSHILQDAEMICNRAAILIDGSVRRQGTLEELTGGEIAGYEICLSGCAGDALGGLGTLIATQDASVYLRVADEAAVDQAIAVIRERGGRIRSIVPSRRTLEDVFLGEIRRRH